MSGKIGRYTYKTERVLKEFIGSLFRALGSRKGRQIAKKLKQDPEMKKLMTKIEKGAVALKKRQDKERKSDPEMDTLLKSFGL